VSEPVTMIGGDGRSDRMTRAPLGTSGAPMSDLEARRLARILLDAAQLEDDNGRGFVMPAGTLPNLPPGPLTLDIARRALGIDQRVWDQEHQGHRIAREIAAGVRKQHRGAS